ncbi:MAG: PilZ domain-containing protein [Bryobacteraceae bacterium]
MQERRSDKRMLCAELVEVLWEQDGRQRRRIANLEDISLSGICLHVEKPISAGTRIVMRYGDGRLFGTVRYCVFREIGYFLGIQLEENCRWSSLHFRPEHLTDPTELMERSLARHS